MYTENLRIWVEEKHFLSTKWSQDNNFVEVRCPFHQKEEGNCRCYIDISTQQYSCDKSKTEEHISNMFSLFWEDYPETDDVLQINLHLYIKSGDPFDLVVTAKEIVKVNGKSTYYQEPSGVKRHILFELLEVNEAVRNSKPILWVIGENMVKSLRMYGITATTTINGANNYKIIPEVLKDLPKEANIILCGYMEASKRRYMQTVGEALLKMGITPKIIPVQRLFFGKGEKIILDGLDWSELENRVGERLEEAVAYESSSFCECNKIPPASQKKISVKPQPSKIDLNSFFKRGIVTNY